MRSLWGALVASCCVAGCMAEEIPGSYVVLRIRADPMVRERTERLVIDTLGGATRNSLGTSPRTTRIPADDGPLGWPVEVGLTPQDDDASRVYDMTVHALDAVGAEITIVRVAGGYSKGRTVLLEVTLGDECVDAPCPAASPCSVGRCEPMLIDADSLPRFDGSEPTLVATGEGGISGAGESGDSGGSGGAPPVPPTDASTSIDDMDGSMLPTPDGGISGLDTGAGDDCPETSCCNADQSCDFGDCAMGDCQYTCHSGASCVATCSGGSCLMTCDVDSDCELGCGGGGCTVDCTRPAQCLVTGCPPPTPFTGLCLCNGCIL